MRQVWEDQHRIFVKNNYIGVGHQKMADMLNEKFATCFTKEQIKSFYGNNDLNSGLSGRFEKGQISPNKGIKGVWHQASEKTWFKKGNYPGNRKPIGSERISKDGYLVIKIQDFHGNKNWKEKHRVIWEKHNGPIPKGYCVIFMDGDKKNITIENLTLISQRENSILNKKERRSSIPEITEAYLNIARLQIAKRELTKRKEE